MGEGCVIRNLLRCLLTAVLVLVSAHSDAWFKKGTSSGGGYSIGAVHFDGSSNLGRGANITASNPTSFLQSIWVSNQTLIGNVIPIVSTDNSIFELYTRSISGGGMPSVYMFASGGAIVSGLARVAEIPLNLAGPAWHQIIISGFIGSPWTIQVVLDGVLISPILTGGLATAIAFNEENDFYIGRDGDGNFYLGDMAQYYLLLDNSPFDLSEPANVLKFRSAGGKPVNLLTSGAPTPLLLFDGTASPTGFQVNQGSLGNVFTLTGTLTNASSSPSD